MTDFIDEYAIISSTQMNILFCFRIFHLRFKIFLSLIHFLCMDEITHKIINFYGKKLYSKYWTVCSEYFWFFDYAWWTLELILQIESKSTEKNILKYLNSRKIHKIENFWSKLTNFSKIRPITIHISLKIFIIIKIIVETLKRLLLKHRTKKNA